MVSTLDCDIAYAAGFIDGEGCFQISKNGSVCISITNTSRTSLEKLLHTFKLGSIRNRKQRVNKNQFGYFVYGEDCVEVTKALLPYLVDKLPQAKLILEYREFCKPVRIPGTKGQFKNPEKDVYRDKLAVMKREEHEQV